MLHSTDTHVNLNANVKAVPRALRNTPKRNRIQIQFQQSICNALYCLVPSSCLLQNNHKLNKINLPGFLSWHIKCIIIQMKN